ncbi:hypothetical protein CDIK_3735 [Cucumispora dikerogammari]|nr:hypothetical protein CDIK_3735 [Cucumispora dikerogammari]
MLLTNCFPYDRLKDENSRMDLEKIRSDMLFETNLYRKMLGLPPLITDPILYKSATDFTVEMIKKREYSHELKSGSSISEKTKKILKHKKWINWNENLFYTNKYSSPMIGAQIIHLWQAIDKYNEALINPHNKHCGIGLEFGLCHLNNGCNKVNQMEQFLYVTQHFGTVIEPINDFSSIEIDSDIIDHLRIYKVYCCIYLNEFILGNFYYMESKVKSVIKNSHRLNIIASEQLILSIKRPSDDEKRKKYIESIVYKKSKKKNKVEVIILHLEHYVPPQRLVLIHEGISKQTRNLLKSKKIQKFGMSVILHEDKTFHMLIIFDQSRNRFNSTFRKLVKIPFTRNVRNNNRITENETRF